MFKIGFSAQYRNQTPMEKNTLSAESSSAVKSVVQVFFPERHMTLAYYNDRFNLRKGDLVYVDGKLEGLPGRVVDITYSFKIKLSDYKRVVGKVDVSVKGDLYCCGGHMLAFDRGVIPREKIISWYKGPCEEETVCGEGADEEWFSLETMEGFKVAPEIAERGRDYFWSENVEYIELDNGRGFAIVQGSKPYEVEFNYRDGKIGGIVCDCFCSYNCKHQVAALLQLSSLIEDIKAHYSERYEGSGYFAAINKIKLFDNVFNGEMQTKLTLC